MGRLARWLFEFYWGQGIADDVPALTYYLVLSLAPFALGLAAVEVLLLENVLSVLEVAEQINRFLPTALHGDIRNLVVSTRDDSPLILAGALAAMLWTTSGAIGVIERCESRILGCKRHDVVTGRLRNLVLGVGVAVMVAAAAAGSPVISDAADALKLHGQLPGGLLLVLNALGSIVVFAGIYRWAPRSRLRWRSAAVGAIPAGLAMQGVPALVGLYVGTAAGLAAVRVFLLLAVVLLGLYTMATLMLVGAGVAVRTELRWRGKKAARAREAPEALAPV